MRRERHRRPAELRLADLKLHAAEVERPSFREPGEHLGVRRVDGPERRALDLAVEDDFARVAREDLLVLARNGTGNLLRLRREVHHRLTLKRKLVRNLAVRRGLDSLRDDPLPHETVEVFVVGEVRNVGRCALLHVAAQVHRRAGGEVREDVGTRRHREEVLVVVRLRVLAVVVGILEHAVPSVQRAVGAEHRLALRAVEVRIRVVVLADRVGLAEDALARKLAETARRVVHHRTIADPPLLPHSRMAPVGVVVHVVHLRHELRRGVAELGCGDGRLKAEILLEVVAHSGPVVMLHVRDELVEVALHLNRRARPLAVAVYERVVAVLDTELVEERQRLLGELPRHARLLRGAVLLHEPVAPELLEALAVHVVTTVKSPTTVLVPEGILVVQLHDGDDGILQVVHARVGVHVREQFLRVLLL